MAVIEPVLDINYQQRGWSAKVHDYCWEACDRPGYRLVVGAHEIVLCLGHIEELETSADRHGGYSVADRPSTSPRKWWPWRGLHD